MSNFNAYHSITSLYWDTVNVCSLHYLGRDGNGLPFAPFRALPSLPLYGEHWTTNVYLDLAANSEWPLTSLCSGPCTCSASGVASTVADDKASARARIADFIAEDDRNRWKQ